MTPVSSRSPVQIKILSASPLTSHKGMGIRSFTKRPGRRMYRWMCTKLNEGDCRLLIDECLGRDLRTANRA